MEPRTDDRSVACDAASGQVMHKAGMRKEGVLRQRLYNKGEYIDVELWAVLASDFEP